MDSFEQNATVKVNEMQALYRSFQLTINNQNAEIEKLRNTIYWNNNKIKDFQEIIDSFNKMSLWNFIKLKIKHQNVL